MIVKVDNDEVELEAVETEPSTTIVSTSIVHTYFWPAANDRQCVSRLSSWLWARCVPKEPFIVELKTPQNGISSSTEFVNDLGDARRLAIRLHDNMRLLCDISESGSWLFTVAVTEVSSNTTSSQTMLYTSDRDTWDK